MNTFKRKALMSAVLAGLGVAAGTAEAVYLNPNGLGQVLVYPYYTVNARSGSNYNTYISLVNTTSQAKALRVRFREGKTSAEVLDFNLFLSPNDMWTGAVIPGGTDAASPGRLITTDVSCTNPIIPSTGIDFRNYGYLASAAPAEALPGTGLDRTREGYVEIFEMAILSGTSAANATHTAAGTPANCAALRGAVATLTINNPTGGLAGTGTLINVNQGFDMGYNARALNDFYSGAGVITDVGSATPDMTSADAHSFVVNDSLTAVFSVFASGLNAVSSVFMHTAVINEFILDSGTASQTDWVMTFPTKRYYINSTTGAATTPFTATLTASGACETFTMNFFNREEAGASPSGTDFSPAPPAAAPNSACWESTVVSFRNGLGATAALGSTSGVLASNNTVSILLSTAPQNGWAQINFTGTNATTTGVAPIASGTINVSTGTQLATGAALPQTFLGLPVTGFMVRTFSNGTLTCGSATCLANYSALFDHKYRP